MLNSCGIASCFHKFFLEEKVFTSTLKKQNLLFWIFNELVSKTKNERTIIDIKTMGAAELTNSSNGSWTAKRLGTAALSVQAAVFQSQVSHSFHHAMLQTSGQRSSFRRAAKHFKMLQFSDI